MEQIIKIFENEKFGQIRTITKDGEPWFFACGKLPTFVQAMPKLARAENIPVGRNKLYGWLKGKGVLMANNLPYQAFIDRGYFAVKESVFEVDGLKKTYQQTFVTGKGQHFVINLLKKYYGKE